MFIMLVGAPGSGKSTFANTVSKAVVVSSDDIRRKLYGSEEIQGDPNQVFEVVHNNIIEALENGYDVIFDATNMRRKYREVIMNKIKHIKVRKVCVIFAEPYEVLRDQNDSRARKVPKEIIWKMIKSFEMPTEAEGFDEIVLFNRFSKRGESLLQQMVNFDQDNPNHSLDLFSHCAKAADFIRASTTKMSEDEQEILRRAAAYHDIGKLFTKTYKDLNGKETKYAHYYHHENVGAYMCLLIEELSLPDRIRVAQLVGYHMQPYFNKTEKAQKRWRERLGDRLYELIMELHRADEYAH